MKQSSRTIPSSRRSAESRIHLVARTKALKHAQTDHVAMLWGSTVNDDTGEREPAWCPAALLESPILPAMVDRPEGVIACDGRELPLHLVRALIRGAKACVQAARSLPEGDAQTESANAAQDALYTLGQLGVVIPEIERAPRRDAGKGGAL